ncbi:MAG: exo-alpha-sialidase [Planctomycetes bacterium]|nr:exo-alpha-sialidase [Planctomycetota bacterium]
MTPCITLAFSLVALACPAPQDGPEPEFGFPPTLEEARGEGGHATVGPLNVGKNLRMNGDNTQTLQNEYSLAINPTDRQNFLASSNDYRNGVPILGHYASLDGGKTIVSDGVLPLAGWQNSGDPAVAFDGFGNGYIMGLHFNRSPLTGALFIHKTRDGGRTFDAPKLAFAAAGNLPDKPYITIDQRTSGTYAGSIYITFTGFYSAPSGLQCVSSRDGGATWSSPVAIGSGQGTSPAIGPNGEVYVSWYSTTTIQFRASTNGGTSFGPTRTVAPIVRIPNRLSPTSFRAYSFPTTAVDRSNGPFRGRIHVSWASMNGSTADVFACYSDNAGATWSTPKVVNDSSTGDQFMQWMAVDESGAVFCCWQDRRNDINNRKHECFASASFDGGVTWTKNWLVSETQNDPGSSGFIGDYNGLDALAGRAFATWVDFRNGSQDAYTAAVQADLEFAPVTLSAAAGGTVDLPIKAGPARVGQYYLLVASLGTNAGYKLGDATFFLDLDPLFVLSATVPNQGPFVNTFGVLGAGGFATPSPKFAATPGLLASLAGQSISFGYVLLDKQRFTYGSNPVTVRVTN